LSARLGHLEALPRLPWPDIDVPIDLVTPAGPHLAGALFE
jgi:hypothetical protein